MTKPNPSPKSTSIPEAVQSSNSDSDDTATQGISQEGINNLSTDINIMLSFASRNGIIINTDIIPLIQDSSVDELILAHNLLSKNIAPATPKSIVYINKIYEGGGKKARYTKLPLLRNLVLIAMFFLILFVTTKMSPQVNSISLSKGVFGFEGFSLVINILYFSSVAGLGVSFYLLKDVIVALKEVTLVPEDSISYMSQILPGVMAGIIMSQFLAGYLIGGESGGESGVFLLNTTILALVGGFSSDALFSTLQGIIKKIKAVIN